jgi:RNA polymerase sigma factor (sigma-70 family)
MAAQGTAEVYRSAEHDYRITTVVEGLVNPWGLAFLPNGDLLVTERPGRLRIIRQGVLLPDSVAGLPPIQAIGRGARALASLEQAGLRDVVRHPDFATNRLLYISFVKPGADSLGSIAVVRGRFENDRLTNVQEVFHARADGNRTPRASMWGGRLAFDRQRYLYVTLGDRQWPATGDLTAHPAQQPGVHNGKTVRLHDDGRIPADNPFVGDFVMEEQIYYRLFGDEVKQALEEIPVDFRMVVLLADLQDFAYKEIAEMLDIPIVTVMSRLHRGRKALQRGLYDYAVSRGLTPVSSGEGA